AIRSDVAVESKATPVEAGDSSAANLNAPEQERIIAQAKRARMNPPPPQPQRPFDEDYAGHPLTDAQGQLLTDIEGRHLVADVVAGRVVAGAADEPLSPEEMKGAIKRIGIRLMDIPRNNPVIRKETPKGLRGVYLGEGQQSGPPVGGIYLNTGPSAPDREF